MNITDYKSIFDYRGQSYNNATEKYPNARYIERQSLIDLIHFEGKNHFLDAPAGGGYLADGVQEQFGKQLSISCVEPAANFAAAINKGFQVFNCPMETIPLETESVDIVASLAGLHHIEDRLTVFKEWHRILKAGGQIAVADVEKGSGVDSFLNTFVNQYTPQGHDGLFFPAGEFTSLFDTLGMSEVSERTISVPWVFNSTDAMCEFCMELFYLKNISAQELLEGLQQHVGIEERPDSSFALKWELRYAKALKL